MKASAARGKRHSIMTDYVMRMLGLEVRAQCMAALGNSRVMAVGSTLSCHAFPEWL